MTLEPKTIHFLESFYSIDSLKEHLSSSAGVEWAQKLDLGKICDDDIRLIPLPTKEYAIYHKNACMIEDEASFHAFSRKKTIKKFVLFDPSAPFIPYERLKSILPLGADFAPEKKAICYTWTYDGYDEKFFEKIMGIHALAQTFFEFFPDLCPKIYDIQLVLTERKKIVRSISSELELEKIQPFYDFYISSYAAYLSHIQSLISILKKLFEAKIAHGDLTRSNLVIAQTGGVKALLDFDTACSCEIMHGLYVKSWVSDLVETTRAMIFYQNPESGHENDQRLVFECSQAEQALVEQAIERIRFIYSSLILPLTDHMFMSDHSTLGDEFFDEFFEKSDPSLLFFDFDT